MEGRQCRSFTDEYKRQAVDLFASSAWSIGSMAKQLGLRDSVLRRWVEQRGHRISTRFNQRAPFRPTTPHRGADAGAASYQRRPALIRASKAPSPRPNSTKHDRRCGRYNIRC